MPGTNRPKSLAQFDPLYPPKDYSLVTDSKSTLGIGLKAGYLLNNGIEPFIGIHTLKKVDFGLRLSW